MLTKALLLPVAVGVKVTVMVQLAPTETLVPQSLVCAKSLLFLPPTLILRIFIAVVPVFVKVTVSGWLLVPTF